MEEFGINIFENVNFYERYKALSKKTRINEERLEKVDKKQILDIFKELGSKVIFVSKGSFYQIKDSNNTWDFNLHLSIKYGVVEVILACKNKELGQIIGGPASLICESIEYNQGIKADALVKKPSFDNYETLKEIFKEALSLYEDMKREALKLSHPA